jgi:hypothetical protein
MDRIKTRVQFPARSTRLRRDRRAPMASWALTALSLLLAAMWGTDVLMGRRVSAELQQSEDMAAADAGQGR